jgi:Tesmin/TSO1-like CXC domain, cysteine-rich domain
MVLSRFLSIEDIQCLTNPYAGTHPPLCTTNREPCTVRIASFHLPQPLESRTLLMMQSRSTSSGQPDPAGSGGRRDFDSAGAHELYRVPMGSFTEEDSPPDVEDRPPSPSPGSNSTTDQAPHATHLLYYPGYYPPPYYVPPPPIERRQAQHAPPDRQGHALTFPPHGYAYPGYHYAYPPPSHVRLQAPPSTTKPPPPPAVPPHQLQPVQQPFEAEPIESNWNEMLAHFDDPFPSTASSDSMAPSESTTPTKHRPGIFRSPPSGGLRESPLFRGSPNLSFGVDTSPGGADEEDFPSMGPAFTSLVPEKLNLTDDEDDEPLSVLQQPTTSFPGLMDYFEPGDQALMNVRRSPVQTSSSRASRTKVDQTPSADKLSRPVAPTTKSEAQVPTNKSSAKATNRQQKPQNAAQPMNSWLDQPNSAGGMKRITMGGSQGSMSTSLAGINNMMREQEKQAEQSLPFSRNIQSFHRASQDKVPRRQLPIQMPAQVPLKLPDRRLQPSKPAQTVDSRLSPPEPAQTLNSLAPLKLPDRRSQPPKSSQSVDSKLPRTIQAPENVPNHNHYFVAHAPPAYPMIMFAQGQNPHDFTRNMTSTPRIHSPAMQAEKSLLPRTHEASPQVARGGSLYHPPGLPSMPHGFVPNPGSSPDLPHRYHYPPAHTPQIMHGYGRRPASEPTKPYSGARNSPVELQVSQVHSASKATARVSRQVPSSSASRDSGENPSLKSPPPTTNKENNGALRSPSLSASKRTPCNCKKSKCLKLYCECFSLKLYCDGCKCIECLNTEANREIREKAINDTIAKNKSAFETGSVAAVCKCRKSECLKKYCEVSLLILPRFIR